ncbi:MAG: hypothetical protein IJ081_00215 [Prevotella sp.]|nr:hypothetical protein [Prevotella sp.]
MKKNLMTLAASAAFVVASLTSCMTINSGAAISSNSPVGPKVGEANSTIILGMWSSQGEQNNIKTAADAAGIKKVSHVEYIDKAFLLGLWVKHTTRVYGE